MKNIKVGDILWDQQNQRIMEIVCFGEDQWRQAACLCRHKKTGKPLAYSCHLMFDWCIWLGSTKARR